MHLKTKVLSVAKLKLLDLEKSERGSLETSDRVTGGKARFADLVVAYRQDLQNDAELKPRSRTYREECSARILKSWPQLSTLPRERRSPNRRVLSGPGPPAESEFGAPPGLGARGPRDAPNGSESQREA